MGLLLLTGLLVGFLSSFFGLGGGSIIVPTLYLLYPELPPPTVISTSLGVIFFNGLANLIFFSRQKIFPQIGLLSFLALGMGLGAFGGGFLASQWAPLVLKKILAVTLLATGVGVAFSRPLSFPHPPPREGFKRAMGIFPLGVLAGGISGLTGVGGGVVVVPALLLLYRRPFSSIPAYTGPAMSFGALFGLWALLKRAPPPTALPQVLEGFQWGAFNFALVGILTGTSLVAGFWGTKLAAKADPKKTQKVFALVLLLFAFRLFFPSFPP